MTRDSQYKSRGEFGLVETSVLSCVEVLKKFQSKHKRHTCKLLRPPSSDLHLPTPLPQLRGASTSCQFPHQVALVRFSRSSISFPPIILLVHSPTVILEAASARMAARDRFGAYAEPGLSPLQRAIRELSPTTLILRTDKGGSLTNMIT